jgi:hypothetical protein
LTSCSIIAEELEKYENIDYTIPYCYHTNMVKARKIAEQFSLWQDIVLYPGDCLNLLQDIPDESLTLVVTSPPYNIGKEYEKKLKLETYLRQQAAVIRDGVRDVFLHKVAFVGRLETMLIMGLYTSGHCALSHLY